MPYRLAINGYGRIGRCILRALQESPHNTALQVVAINEPADSATIAHLTKYDSTHGRFPGDVLLERDTLRINGWDIEISHEESIDHLDWSQSQTDLVLECSGTFTDRVTAEKHLQGGAGRVLLSQPAERDVDATIVYGVNHRKLSARHRIISNASCTTNCIVPIIVSLDEALGIEMGHISTIHSAMNDQPVIDAYHHTDLRRTRSAGVSIIPVETGLSKGIDRLLPKLAGRFSASAMRVPTTNVSLMELSIYTKTRVTGGREEVNWILRKAAETGFNGVLGYTEELLASCDFNHDTRSSIVDGGQTSVVGGNLVKVQAWFDNEWGFANRMLDVAVELSKLESIN